MKDQGGGWGEYLRAAERLFDDAKVDEEEGYKARLAEALAEVRTALMQGDEGWSEHLVKAVQDRENNLINWQDKGTITGWIEGRTAAVKSALMELWAPGDATPVDRVRTFESVIPDDVFSKRRVTARLDLASYLMMAMTDMHLPPVKLTVFDRTYRRVGHPRCEANDVAGKYDHALRFLDRLIAEAKSRDMKRPTTRLDAQSVVWSLKNWEGTSSDENGELPGPARPTMLERLELENVGPAPRMALDLQPRLNLITGDNGLGKSFLLDVAWWALTRKWPRDLNPSLTSGYAARPTDAARPAKLRLALRTDDGTSVSYESAYSARDESWSGQRTRPSTLGLVIHAHADGGFSVWDPARNFWRTRGNIDVQDRLPGYVFSPRDVWSGLFAPIGGKRTKVCKGLLDDWSSWIRERGENARRMAEVVGALGVPNEPLDVGPILRLSVDDAQDIPSIKTEYSKAVPVVHASSAVRRIIGLAYMLVWSWSEHLRAARQLQTDVASQVILLFDEVEAHLHPRWQRAIVPALLGVMDRLTNQAAGVQLIAVTHSPLVLASVEPHFDETSDRLFHLDMHDGRVQLDVVPWAAQGDALNWLVSDVFGLRQARSIEAERAIDAAQAFMRGEAGQNPERLRERGEIHAELQRVLAGHDPFWPRWIMTPEHDDGP